MDANQIIKEMNDNLERNVKAGTLTLEKLDDLAFDSLEKIKEILNQNVQNTLKNAQEEVKKKSVQTVKSRIHPKKAIHLKLY